MGSLSRDLDLPYVAAKAAVELDSGFNSGDDLPGLRSLRQYLHQWVSVPVFPWLTDALRKELLLDRRSEQDHRLNAPNDVELAVESACDRAGLQELRTQIGLRGLAKEVLKSLDACMQSGSTPDGDGNAPLQQGSCISSANEPHLSPLPSRDTLVTFLVSLSSEIIESQKEFADSGEAGYYF
jgi:hypothetical protein